jgi:hypothetical protein
LVDGKLLVVRPETVAMGIGIREETGLEDGIRGRLNVRNKVRRCKGDLFDFGKIVLRVLVENDLANGTKRVFLV